jgi:hypothetical protein
MGRWTDLATWRGPTVNQSGAMSEHRGLVVHIAEGSFEGTISWERNASARVSSHFVTAADGRIAQVVDTDVTAWTQIAGNGHWLSVENEGRTPNALTPAQCEAIARLLLRAHEAYGVPLQVTSSPTGRGLGYHSMGGTAWGHLACPGPAIIAQLPGIVARATQLAGGVPASAPIGGPVFLAINGKSIVLTDGLTARYAGDYAAMSQYLGHLPQVDLSGPEWQRVMALPSGPPPAGVVTMTAEDREAIADAAADVMGERLTALERDLSGMAGALSDLRAKVHAGAVATAG